MALLLTGCGSEDTGGAKNATAQEPPSASLPTADPKREWTNALAQLCTDLAGVVAGRQIADFTDDNRYTPDEILAAQRDATPALAAFDRGYTELTAPPEAAEAKRAFDAFLTASKAPATSLVAAAEKGDQVALTKAFAMLEGVRLGPTGVQSFTSQGVAEKCRYRGSYV